MFSMRTVTRCGGIKRVQKQCSRFSADFPKDNLPFRSLVRLWKQTLLSITSPGVSPKIHTFCQSSGIEGGWNGAKARGRERREGEVFKATGRPFPWGSVAGRQDFSSDPRQLSPKLK